MFDRFESYGDQIALVTGDGDCSYRKLQGLISRAGEFLRSLPEGVYLVGHDYSPSTVAILLAAIKEPVVVAPVTTRRQEELLGLATHCGAKGLITFAGGLGEWHCEAFETASAPPQLAADLLDRKRSGLVLFSSGITGKPKAILHDLKKWTEPFLDRKPRSASVLLFLLFDHIGGLNTLFGSLAAGMMLVVPGSRSPEAIARLVEKHKVRILPTTPTFLNLLLIEKVDERFDLSSLRIITYGAEAMPEALLQRIRKSFPKCRLIQTFGTSETGIARTVPRTDTVLHIDDPSLKTKVVDGELWLKSRTQTLGYLGESNERFTEDGWFRTGDRVELEADGTLRFLGRTVEIINVGGEKVFPAEVESALLGIPEIDACRIFGVPNPILGQAVCAEVVSSADIPPAELRSIVRRFAREHLPRHKIPVDIRLVPEVHIGPRGKRGGVEKG